MGLYLEYLFKTTPLLPIVTITLYFLTSHLCVVSVIVALSLAQALVDSSFLS